jgi:AcrR family transcriptional regulator
MTMEVEREQQIIDHARKLFSRGGFRETSLQDVADQLGLTRPAFYYYFKSKDELLWRLIGNLGDEVIEMAKPIVESPEPPATKLGKLMATHVRTFLNNADAFNIYIAERHLLGKVRHRRMRKNERAYVDLAAGVIAEGQRAGDFRDGDPRLLTLLVLGLANSVLRWYRPNGPAGIDTIATTVSELAVSGLRRQPTAKSAANGA